MRCKDLRVLNPMVSKDLLKLNEKELMAYAIKAQGLLEEVRNYELAKRTAYYNLKDMNKKIKKEIVKVPAKAIEKKLQFESKEECLNEYYLELSNTGKVSVPKNVEIKQESSIPEILQIARNKQKQVNNKPEVVIEQPIVEKESVEVSSSNEIDITAVEDFIILHTGACMNKNQQSEVKALNHAEDYISSLYDERENKECISKMFEALKDCTNQVIINGLNNLFTSNTKEVIQESNVNTNEVFRKPINNISTVNLVDGYYNGIKLGTVVVNGNTYNVEANEASLGPVVFNCIDPSTLIAVKQEIEKAYGTYFIGSSIVGATKPFRGKVLNSKGEKLNAQCSKAPNTDSYNGFVNEFYFSWDMNYKQPIVVKVSDYMNNNGTVAKAPKVKVTDAVIAVISQAIAICKGGGTNE